MSALGPGLNWGAGRVRGFPGAGVGLRGEEGGTSRLRTWGVARRIPLGPQGAPGLLRTSFSGPKAIVLARKGKLGRSEAAAFCPRLRGALLRGAPDSIALRLFEFGFPRSRALDLFCAGAKGLGVGEGMEDKVLEGDGGLGGVVGSKIRAAQLFPPKARGENASIENANCSVSLLLVMKSGTQSRSFRAHVGRKGTALFNLFHDFDEMNVGGRLGARFKAVFLT